MTQPVFKLNTQISNQMVTSQSTIHCKMQTLMKELELQAQVTALMQVVNALLPSMLHHQRQITKLLILITPITQLFTPVVHSKSSFGF